MASTSASSIQKSFKYDVFLSFRGEDTRKTFVDHLYDALIQKSIITYKDDERIDKGEKIGDQLLGSIEESRFHIIVLSKNYASSSWCLDELVKIMECQKTIEQTAYPIFYDVEPTEIRKQSGAVGEAFGNHVGKEGIARWRCALKEVADLAGWELKNTNDGYEAKLIQKIVQEILSKLHFINSSIDGKLQGMETRVKEVVTSLKIDSSDARMIGIKGIGGGGKTTLARSVFDHISIWFDGKSFVENVRERSKGFGLKELQKQILLDVLNDQRIVVPSVYDGKNMMKRHMCSRKVLVVLDDVDHLDQLEALAGDLNWFKLGSRIIITTRDEQVLVAHGVHRDNIHNVSLLSFEEAICLFNVYAFKKEIPSQEYQELSAKVIQYAAGLPLTIKVLGSFLCGRSKCEWEETIERLKTIPLKETLEKLELSYNGLENDHKEIFLEVACILKGERKDAAIRVLESCGYHARIGLSVLEQKSLITAPKFDHSELLDNIIPVSTLYTYLSYTEERRNPSYCLQLHDHFEEMGMNIVRRMHPNDPSRHTRLWIQEEIEDTLVNELGTQAIKSIKLKNTNLHPAVIMKGLRNLKELRVLYVGNRYSRSDIDDEVSQYLPDTLRSIDWFRYPFQCLPETFRASNLVNLVMEWSNISQLWEGAEKKALNKLKFLCLKYSMLKSLDLGLAPNLETLDLRGCDDFVELTMPHECRNLKYLNLSGSKLINLEFGLTPHLETLNLGGCNQFVALNITHECPKLKTLNLSGSKVSNLNLQLTPNIESLLLEGCYYLQEIHAPVGCLKKLVHLNLNGCLRFQELLFLERYKLHGLDSFAKLQLIATPLEICPLHPNSTLPKFQFRCAYDEPQSFRSGNFEKLISFGLCACTNLDSFSASICSLLYLRKLTLKGSIPEAPKDLNHLESLEELALSLQKIKHLPDSICMLKHMKHLKLDSCWLLERLPTDLDRLEHLEGLDLTNCISLRDIPNSICEMKCLKHLLLSYCVLVEKLPEEIGKLNLMMELDIEGAGICHLPPSIVQLKGLCIIGSRWQLESCGFTSFHSAVFKSRYAAMCYI